MKSVLRREHASGRAIAELISTAAIPVTATLSDTQKRLAGKLASAISDLVSDADTFAERAVRTLVLGGDYTGLAEDLYKLVILRAAAIKQSPLEAAGLDCYTDRRPLWLWFDRGRLDLLDDQAVKDILAWPTGFIRR